VSQGLHQTEGGPLSLPAFRRIWATSLIGNFGLLIQGVGASWAMTELTSSPRLVTLVQTSLMLPVMLLSMAAGAAADMYDRRKVVLGALGLCCAGATLLTLLMATGLASPAILLGGCFLISCGMAIFSPSWQASVGELVPPALLAPAIALNSISYNIARSLGPAIGGVIVAATGSAAAFGASAVLYLPVISAFLLWRRPAEPRRLPPERLGWAIMAGLRYIRHAPPVRTVILRTFLTGVAGGSLSGLMPLIARNSLNGGAGTFGLLLGLTGSGAVVGALSAASVRRRLTNEQIVCGCAAITGLAFAIIAVSRTVLFTAPALFTTGAAWMVMVTMLNIGVQVAVPRWVAGRALAGYQAAIAGGVGVGSWLWGQVASTTSVTSAMLLSGAAMIAAALLGVVLRIPPDQRVSEGSGIADPPQVGLALTGRSGPVSIEVEYLVTPARARAFYSVMQEVRRIRKRNGAFDWSVSRDISAPETWVERFHYPTWADYLRQRDRRTAAEEAFERDALQGIVDPGSTRVRRWLERPFGSVRWKEDTPDPGRDAVIIAPAPPSTP